MIKTLSITNIFSASRPRPSIKSIGLEAESRPWLLYAAVAVNAALLLSYLFGVNARASTGYEIKQLEKQIKTLEQEQKALNVKLSEATAISFLNEDFVNSGFVEAGTPRFISVEEKSTAMK